jgi:hypothetical protein
MDLHIFPTESVLVLHFCPGICRLGLPLIVHSIFFQWMSWVDSIPICNGNGAIEWHTGVGLGDQIYYYNLKKEI